MTSQDFASQVLANQAAETAPDNLSSLNINNRSQLDVRNRGCYIVRAALLSPSSGEIVPILFSDSDRTKPKLNASHPMSPVGPFDGPGGQHGPSRWLDFRAQSLGLSGDTEKVMIMRPVHSQEDQTLKKSFWLSESQLTTITSVGNLGRTTLSTSIGAHDYYRLTDENPNGLLVNGQTIDELFEETGKLDEIMSGKTGIIDNFSSANISFPAGYEINLTARGMANGKPANELVGLMIWHRPGTQSICFEPTLGHDSSERNDLLQIEPGMHASLSSMTQLL
jgi:hypothetical protein